MSNLNGMLSAVDFSPYTGFSLGPMYSLKANPHSWPNLGQRARQSLESARMGLAQTAR